MADSPTAELKSSLDELHCRTPVIHQW